MRIILGCARTTQIEITRIELNLPSIYHRIKELIVAAVIRMVRRGDDGLVSLLDKCQNGHNYVKVNSYDKKLYKASLDYDAVKYCTLLEMDNRVRPWLQDRISVDILQLGAKKDELCTLELKQIFLPKINSLPRCNVVHMYCDGSVNGIKAGCGAVIREYFEEDISFDEHISKRVGDYTSTTSAELHAIYEGLVVASMKGKDIFVFVDSQSALLSLNSTNTVNSELVSQCKDIIYRLKAVEHTAKFMWIPSHIGIYLNEIADKLAKEATNKGYIDSETNMSLRRMKGVIRNIRQEWDLENIQKIIDKGSESMKHYITVYENTNVTYGRASTRVDTVIMRLRLGYKYYWEFVNGGDGIPCKLCNAEKSHTLQHYVCHCHKIEEFRNQDLTDIAEQTCHIINSNVIPSILKKYKYFAYRI